MILTSWKPWPHLIIFLAATALHAQISQFPATTDSVAAVGDTLAVRPPANKTGLDAPIEYEARTVEHVIAERLTILTGKAKVKYKTITLEAGKITVDWDNNLLTAEVWHDSSAALQSDQNGAADSSDSWLAGLPTLSDRGDRMAGEQMQFNFATEKGRVLRGRTEFEGAHYSGGIIKRVESNVLDVGCGRYSTCDKDENPHYHFWSRKMKLVIGDKVIAKPVVMYIGKVPVAILPFALFPMKSGRHSGLIIPRFGRSEIEGRFLRDLGYYWVINDYLDFRGTVDFFELSGWLFKGGVNYAKRYDFTGSISGSLTRKDFSLSDRQERLWDLAISHNQNFGERSALRVSGNFVSNNSFYKDLSDNRDQQLTRRLQSRATYSTSFGGGRNSLSINLSSTQDLDDGSFQRTLPQIGLSFPQRQIFGNREASSSQSRVRAREPKSPPWYNYFYISMTNRGEYSISKAASDTAETEERGTANHVLSLSYNSPNRIGGWLNLNHSLSINEDWFDRRQQFTAELGPDSAYTAKSEVDHGFAARHTFGYSLTGSTKLYGLFPLNVGSIQALRHTLTPSLSFSFRPDFSDPWWGYYQEFDQIQGSDGKPLRVDRFGGTSRGTIASLNYSLNNLFQMKAGTEEKNKKLDLFTLTLGSGYNFAADEFKHFDLLTSIQSNPARNLSLTLGTTHSPYAVDSTGNRINTYLLGHGGFLRLTSFRTDATLRVQGSTGGQSQGGPGSDQDLEENLDQNYGLQNIGSADRFGPEMGLADTAVPWQASFALSYSVSRSNPLRTSRTAQLSLRNGEVGISKNWRVGVSMQYDLIKNQLIDQRYTIRRDLHCWEMQAYWTPTGPRKSFYIRIGIKASHLRDLKVERGGRSSVFGGAYY